MAFSFSGPKVRKVDNRRRSALERSVKYVISADLAAEVEAGVPAPLLPSIEFPRALFVERTRAVGSARLRSNPRSGSAANRFESRRVWNRDASIRAEAPFRVREI